MKDMNVGNKRTQVLLDHSQAKRPLIITIICSIGFALTAMAVISLLNPYIRQQLIEAGGAMQFTLLIFLTLLGMAGLIGTWLMRRWGVYVYTAAQIINLVVGLITEGTATLNGALVSLVIVGIFFANLKRMK